jgi:hypothetical protein
MASGEGHISGNFFSAECVMTEPGEQRSAKERQPAAELRSALYAELRRLAAALTSRLPSGQTLQPTALVHEAYLRLVRHQDPGWEGRRHFFGAAAQAMREILIWDARTHRVAARFRGHEAVLTWATFSPDGRLLATCSKDGTLRLWTIASGACQVLRGHIDDVFTAAFLKGGTRLATAGRDRAVWLWDLAKGEEVVQLRGHTSYIWSLAISPDGQTLVSGSGDFTVRLWDTAPLAARYQAQRQAAALRPEAERLVEGLFARLREPGRVVDQVRADPSLSERQRHAAFRAVLRRAEANRF